MLDQSGNNVRESVVFQTVLHQFLQSSNCRHRLGASPMAVLVQLFVKAVMSGYLSGVYVGSVHLYNLKRVRRGDQGGGDRD